MMLKLDSFIYFDHNATTAVDERVLQTMLPYFNQNFANAASITYGMALSAKSAVDEAREQVAGMLNCLAQEISFTSGATEAINTAIKGVFWKYQVKGKHFVSVATEHPAVLDTLRWIETQGAEVTLLQVNEQGEINLEELKDAIREDTVAVVAMLANNETGVIYPIREVADIVHEKKSILICDATQAIGKMKVDVQELGIDVLALSGHKFYAPKGVGALYLRRRGPRVVINPLMHGGQHERGNRSGTLNVPGIIGLGHAAQLSTEFIESYKQNVNPIRLWLEKQLISNNIARINASQAPRLSNTINAELIQVRAESVIKKIQTEVAVSTGSACSAADPKPSHVLLAMGKSVEEAHHTIRISLGVENTMEEAERFIELLKSI